MTPSAPLPPAAVELGTSLGLRVIAAARIMEKLSVNHWSELVRYALKRRLLTAAE